VPYPRWVDSSNRGLGAPTFVFYSPLAFYFVAMVAVPMGDVIEGLRYSAILFTRLARPLPVLHSVGSHASRHGVHDALGSGPLRAGSRRLGGPLPGAATHERRRCRRPPVCGNLPASHARTPRGRPARLHRQLRPRRLAAQPALPGRARGRLQGRPHQAHGAGRLDLPSDARRVRGIDPRVAPAPGARARTHWSGETRGSAAARTRLLLSGPADTSGLAALGIRAGARQRAVPLALLRFPRPCDGESGGLYARSRSGWLLGEAASRHAGTDCTREPARSARGISRSGPPGVSI
jgi:hypothetical protein